MRTLCLSAGGTHPADDIAALLRLMPNLHDIVDFPEIEDALPVLPQEPLRLELLTIVPWRVHCPSLPLLLEHRWAARSVHLWVSRETWDFLSGVDWPAVQPLVETADLRLLLSVPRRGGPAPALALISACPNLRRLDLYASAAEIVDILPAIFRACSGLRELTLGVRDDDAPEETARAIDAVAGILREALPPALRMLNAHSASVELSKFDMGSLAVPEEVADSVQGIVAVSYEGPGELAALSSLLASCPNLRYLRVHGQNIAGLARAVSRPFPHMGTLSFSADRRQPAEDLAALLRLMPKLHAVVDFPGIQDALPVLPQEPLHLDILSIVPWRACSPSLPLLLMRRWTARDVDLWVSSETWNFLAEVDWPAVQPLLETSDLRLIINAPRSGGPAAAAAFICACPNLRRLELYASAAELLEVLPAVFGACRGLCELHMDVRDDNRAETARDIDAVACLFLGARLHTLRSLRVDLPHAELIRSRRLCELQKACQARRITCCLHYAR
ncbi:hypothetical protein AURDEDRAFT_125037 [Auricularia subglabra TFB-10046 SS5]|nr:hypothetical protein AURDEDRAFT_125037 [Auricularia subglabra TFB-10046 SS5]